MFHWASSMFFFILNGALKKWSNLFERVLKKHTPLESTEWKWEQIILFVKERTRKGTSDLWMKKYGKIVSP